MNAADAPALAAGCAAALLFVGLLLPRLSVGAGLAAGVGLAAAAVVAGQIWLPGPWWVATVAALAGGLLARLGSRPAAPGHEPPVSDAGLPAAVPVETPPPSDAPVPPAPEEPWAAPRGVPAGTPATLGRFRIAGVLGRGAMGTVYLAHDPETGAEVAIKTMALAREFAGEALAEARRRFFREAETAGRLRHPDIVAIHATGEDAGLAWIAMERLHGHDLTVHTQPDRLLPPEEAVAVVARVAEALAFAHTQGVVHRDVKPANVMIDGDTSQVKVTDFGIARVTDSARTRTGIMLGTPAYMSPEQLSGAKVDGRSDLYSLGVLLFELLTGRRPHPEASMGRLMYAIANEPAPDLRSLRPELPAQLADAVALALQKRPEMRCADGRAWAADLRTIAGMPPAPAAPAATSAAPPASAAGGGDAPGLRNTGVPMQNPRS